MSKSKYRGVASYLFFKPNCKSLLIDEHPNLFKMQYSNICDIMGLTVMPR